MFNYKRMYFIVQALEKYMVREMVGWRIIKEAQTIAKISIFNYFFVV